MRQSHVSQLHQIHFFALSTYSTKSSQQNTRDRVMHETTCKIPNHRILSMSTPKVKEVIP